LNGEKVLWLPVESRPRCSKVRGNTLALGHVSGRIPFIGSCIQIRLISVSSHSFIFLFFYKRRISEKREIIQLDTTIRSSHDPTHSSNASLLVNLVIIMAKEETRSRFYEQTVATDSVTVILSNYN
jgi:hypothetical protein